jgi:hypothetical protein
MAQRTTFEKLQRDRAKKAKAAAKRERRLEKAASAGTEDEQEALPPLSDDGKELSAAELLERIEQLHKRFEAKAMSFEEFEEEKAELMARLPVD